MNIVADIRLQPASPDVYKSNSTKVTLKPWYSQSNKNKKTVTKLLNLDSLFPGDPLIIFLKVVFQNG